MIRHIFSTSGIRKACIMAVSVSVIAIIAVMALAVCPADAAVKKSDSEKAAETAEIPIREVHRVKVDGRRYCCFVQYNVVLTPSEIADLSDLELVDEVVKRAGFYMKPSNCRVPSHTSISYKSWIKGNRSFLLRDSDIEAMRSADPSGGEPVKLYMDLGISPDPEPEEPVDPEEEEEEDPDGEIDEDKGRDKDGEAAADTEDPSAGDDESGDGEGEDPGEDPEEDPEDDPSIDPEDELDRDVYWTRKLLSPHLIYVVIATEKDAKAGEDTCNYKAPKPEDDVPDGPDKPEKKDMLPEFRTISMVDRSGPPLVPTLEDGDEVYLEWIEPGRHAIDKDATWLDRIPGGIWTLLFIVFAIAAEIAIFVYKYKKRKAYRNR